jgi:hypothetical protein
LTYAEWYHNHARKHTEIVSELRHLTDDELIDYFDFDNMKVKHPDFCPLYPKDQKCHDMERLNCYLCACMHFRFNDDGIKAINDKTLYSYCGIDSKNRGIYEDSKSIHNDCSNCKVPHKKHVIEKYFSRNWKEMMKNCDLAPEALQ